MDHERRKRNSRYYWGDDALNNAKRGPWRCWRIYPGLRGRNVNCFPGFFPHPAPPTLVLDGGGALTRPSNALKEKGLFAHPELLLGVPRSSSLSMPRKKPDLIIYRCEGIAGHGWNSCGWVAQQVVDICSLPRWLVVRAPSMACGRVMVVMDGSASSQHALRFLGELPFTRPEHG